MATRKKLKSKKKLIKKKSVKQKGKTAKKSKKAKAPSKGTKKRKTTKPKPVSRVKKTRKKVSPKRFKIKVKKQKRLKTKKKKTPKPKKEIKLVEVIKRKKVLPLRIPFYDVDTGSAEIFGEPIYGAVETYMNASHANVKDPDIALPEAFEKAFIGSLRKGPFEADEVLVYRFGIILRPRQGRMSEILKDKISNYLKDIPGSSAHHIKEEKTFSLRINLGSAVKGVLSGVVSEELNKFKSILSDVYSTFNDWFEETVDWFSFWDTEETMYA